MSAPPENTLRRLTRKMLFFLLRLYLVPLKKILHAKPAPASQFGQFKRRLKTHLTGNADLLAQLLDPDMPELHTALTDKRTTTLQRLLSANNFSLFNIFLETSGATGERALHAYLHPESKALHTLMLADNAARLKSLLPPDSETLEILMLADNAARLKTLLPPDSQTLEILMLADDAARLKALVAPESVTLTKVMLDDDASRLKAVLDESTHYRKILKALKASFPPDTQILFDLMADDNAARLRAVMTTNGYALARKVLDVRSEILGAALEADDQKAMRVYLFENDFERLLPLLDSNNGKVYRHLLLMADSPLLRILVSAWEGKLLHMVLFQQGLMHHISTLPLARAWCEFDRQWESFCPWADHKDSTLSDRLQKQRGKVTGRASVSERLVDVIHQDEYLHLFNGKLRFTDRYALFVLFQEILVNQDYYALIDNARPVIIDCGAHQGMSLYYFKTIFPDARIIAFEPDPVNRAIAQGNIERMGFSDVDILPYALASREGSHIFHAQQGHSMAGSLTERRAKMAAGDGAMETFEVQCVQLSHYLQEEIDYLKIDIEGVEDEVLEESAHQLHRVRYIFCEYHHGLGLANDRLVRILELLEQHGFDAQVTKSYNFQRRTEHKPMNYVGEYYSSIIFARNRLLCSDAGVPGQ